MFKRIDGKICIDVPEIWAGPGQRRKSGMGHIMTALDGEAHVLAFLLFLATR